MIIYDKNKPLRFGYCVNEYIQGDCIDVMGHFPNESIDLIITSPPYNLGNNHHTGNYRHSPYADDMPEDDYQKWQIIFLNECHRVLNSNGSMFYNHKNRIKDGIQISPYQWLLKTNFIIKQELVWENGGQNFDKIRFYPFTERVYWLAKSKNTKILNSINHGDIWKRNEWIPRKTKGEHKRAFPDEMVRNFIECCPSSEIILDPFAGSGTTLYVARELGRKYIGIEINPEYIKLIEKRLAQNEISF